MKDSNLEMIRGIAAMLVFFCHLVMFYPVELPNIIKMLFNWGTEAVYIFFILSGIVIHISTSKVKKTAVHFVIDRFFRLVPVYLSGIMISIIVMLNLKMDISIETIIGNLLFLGTLQGYIVEAIKTNQPVWSLTFEVFFYALFALTMIGNQKRNLKFWFIISLVSLIGIKMDIENDIVRHFIMMFAFSTGWLLGYFISAKKSEINYFSKRQAVFSLFLLPAISRLHLSSDYYDPIKYILFCIVSIPFFTFILNNKSEKHQSKLITPVFAIIYLLVVLHLLIYSQSNLSSKLIYITVPFFAFLKINFGFSFLLDKIKKILSDQLGKYSYSLYILHFPILFYLGEIMEQPELYLIFGICGTLMMVFIAEIGINRFGTEMKRKIITLIN